MFDSALLEDFKNKSSIEYYILQELSIHCFQNLYSRVFLVNSRYQHDEIRASLNQLLNRFNTL